MTEAENSRTGLIPVKGLSKLAALTLCAFVAACAQPGGPSPLELATAPMKSETGGSQPPDSRTELVKATEYWGKEYGKNPRDAKAALSYARNLKAMGEKRQALAVLQQASASHSGNREFIGEYGRLALEFDQVSIAQKLLEHADDPTKPDWRIISARGTVLAKQGNYSGAIPLYERALTLSSDQPSVLNNLALAHAMNGNPDRAETLLKRAAASGSEPRVTQNLALVLGLQGKYDDAKVAATRHQSAEDASADVAYLRSIVKLEPLAASLSEPPPARVTAAPAPTGLRGTAVETRSAGWAPVVAASPAR